MVNDVSRRQLFAAVAATFGLAPLVGWLGRGQPSSQNVEQHRFPVARTDAEWRGTLTPQQYRVLREHRTERAFSSPLDHESRHGTFVCAACGQPLFSSAAKYASGTGWPSFWAPLEGAVGTSIDHSFFMIRTEVHCARCGGHLGHVFPDGPKPAKGSALGVPSEAARALGWLAVPALARSARLDRYANRKQNSRSDPHSGPTGLRYCMNGIAMTFVPDV
jgi:peptide-methionine (R)-S-oxide reductase